MSQKKTLKFIGKILQILIVIGVIIYLFKGINLRKLYFVLSHYSLLFSFFTIFLIFLSYVALSLRWDYLTNKTLGFLPSFETVIIADFINIVLPARIGDLSKIFYLKKYYNKETHTTFSALFIERFLDINMLLLFTIIISFIYTDNKRIKIALVMLLFIILFFLLLIKTKISKFLLYLIPIARIKEYGLKLIEEVNKGLTLKSLFVSVFYTFFLWIIYFLKNVVFFRYTAGFHLSIFEIFVLFAVSTISFVVPITPGGIGTYQASVVFVATLYGVDKEPALLAGLVLQFFQILFTSLAFFIIFVTKNVSISTFRNIKKEEIA